MLRFLLLTPFLITHAFSATILFIGDSHSVGPFGWYFDQHLRDSQHQVATYASCGSIPRWWMTGQTTPCGYFSRDLRGVKTQLPSAPTPILEQLLNEIRPDVVVMEFGGNYVVTPNDEFVINDIRRIVSDVKASGAACFWITNPDTRKNREHIPRILRLIKEAVGPECPIFESHLVTRYPETGGDGIHYWNPQGLPIAREWAQKAFEAFKTHF